MQPEIRHSGLKNLNGISHLSKSKVAGIAKHPPTFSCFMVMVNTERAILANLVAYIALVLALGTFLIILNQADPMFPAELVVFCIKAYLGAILFVMVSLASAVGFWIGLAPCLTPFDLLVTRCRFPVIGDAFASFGTILSWLYPKGFGLITAPLADCFQCNVSKSVWHYKSLS